MRAVIAALFLTSLTGCLQSGGLDEATALRLAQEHFETGAGRNLRLDFAAKGNTTDPTFKFNADVAWWIITNKEIAQIRRFNYHLNSLHINEAFQDSISQILVKRCPEDATSVSKECYLSVTGIWAKEKPVEVTELAIDSELGIAKAVLRTEFVSAGLCDVISNEFGSCDAIALSLHPRYKSLRELLDEYNAKERTVRVAFKKWDDGWRIIN